VHEIAAKRPVLLVVDDELPILSVIRSLGGKGGFEVVTCTSSERCAA
jgi:CheY-like chemotaxis protein